MNIPPEIRPQTGGEARRITTPREELVATIERLRTDNQLRLATMVGLDERRMTGQFRLVYLFAHDDSGGWTSVETEIPATDPVFPSVTPILPAAHWYEREVQDLLGLTPAGHPDPRRLVLHENWPDGVYPLRKDFDPADLAMTVSRKPFEFHRLHGEGLVEIPVGPIHAGIIEPGHFRFAAVGDVVLHLEARLFYTHRGIEKLAEGRHFDAVLPLAERICGACSAANAAAYCQAVEAAAGFEAPRRAQWLRVLFLELERLYNHLGDLGNICAGTGFAVGTAYGARLKESVQRLNERLCGNRFLHGVFRPGGMLVDIDSAQIRDVASTLAGLKIEAEQLSDLLLGNESFRDRLEGTGVLPAEAVEALGGVGLAARASGLARDSRRDHPYAAYADLTVPSHPGSAGDVLARLQARIDETRSTIGIVDEVLNTLPEGSVWEQVPQPRPWSEAFGWAESARGETLHWIRTGPAGSIDRYRVRSASYSNWPLVALTVPGNLVPDFPVINKSFELCYACLDR